MSKVLGIAKKDTKVYLTAISEEKQVGKLILIVNGLIRL